MYMSGTIGFVYRLFIFIASILAILLILRECGITKKLSPMKASDYVSVIAVFLVLYSLGAITLAVFYPILNLRITMILFGVIPFVIGKVADYKKVRTYSIIQILCVILSILFLLFNY